MRDYLAERSAHIAAAAPGEHAARRLSEMTDEAVRELSRAASSVISGRWALMALGGWGSGALLPASDLDLLVLADGPPDTLRPFVEAVLYPLWDAGLKVGHQVRSPKQQKRAMRDDLQTCTAALTARPIAGDLAWAADCAADWRADAQRRPRRVIRDLAERERPGSPYLLALDLKNGAGGRRDYDELRWTAIAISGQQDRGLAPLVDAGYLDAVAASTLDAAAEQVATARWELQRAGYGDRLNEETAGDLRAIDAESVQEAVVRTAVALDRIRQAIAGGTRDAGEVRAGLSAEELFAHLGAGDAALPALEAGAASGFVDALVPGYQSLMWCRRPGLGHELTVGAHSLRAACLALSPPPADGALARSLAAVRDPRVTLAAALLHDAAKQHAGTDHAEQGAEPARRAAHSLGLSAQAGDDVADLVRLHLVLVETALHDDLDDEDAILRCAARVQRAELLAPLHLLTAADSRATGPATWTPWTAALVGTLVARLDNALSPDVDGAGLAVRGEAARAAALADLAPASSAERTFLEHAPLRYLAAREPAEIMRHAGLVAALSAAPTATGALIEVSAGPAEETRTVTVAALDRPELLARLAGATALAGLDILAVDAYSAGPGIALDRFVVTSATRSPMSTDTFAKLERLATAALRDRLELAVRLRERRRHYPVRAKGAVQVSTRAAGWATELRVSAPDRPGLLHDVVAAVAAEGLDIRWAKVQTIEGVARDVFHLVGPDGGPVDDPGALGHVAMRIRSSL